MRYLCTTLLVLLVTSAQAQTDSVRTEYKTEDERISTAEVKRFIRYITRANVEEKTLIKVDIWPATSSNSTRSYKPLFDFGINAETSIERKINPAFSLYAGINYSLRYTQYERVLLNTPINGLSTSYDRQIYSTLMPKVGARYYYLKLRKVYAYHKIILLKKPEFSQSSLNGFNVQSTFEGKLIRAFNKLKTF